MCAVWRCVKVKPQRDTGALAGADGRRRRGLARRQAVSRRTCMACHTAAARPWALHWGWSVLCRCAAERSDAGGRWVGKNRERRKDAPKTGKATKRAIGGRERFAVSEKKRG